MTNVELESKILAIVKISKADLDSYFPAPIDKQQLFELMKIVRSAADDNKKKQEIISKIGDFANVIIKIAKFVI